MKRTLEIGKRKDRFVRSKYSTYYSRRVYDLTNSAATCQMKHTKPHPRQREYQICNLISGKYKAVPVEAMNSYGVVKLQSPAALPSRKLLQFPSRRADEPQ